MAKRKNLRNPDILPFDYVSILLNWRTNSPLTATPTFTVAEVLGGTFPFNARMLSFTAVDSSSSISFTFQSPFDINTSPWQFELELAFTTTVSKFRPTAVYNGSNNQVTVKFNISPLVATTSYPVVFTAKRYRPTTQYLAQLAAAAQNPVTINTIGSINSSFFYNTSSSLNAVPLSPQGFIFQAPNNFVITTAGYAFNFGSPIPYYLRIIKFPTMPSFNVATVNFVNLFNNNKVDTNGSFSVNLNINTGDIIGIVSSRLVNGSYQYLTSSFTSTPYTATIGATTVPIDNIFADTAPPDAFISITRVGTSNIPSLSTVNFTSAGGTAWSNIIY